MKRCQKCGRTSPPALSVCPRCKTPFSPIAVEEATVDQKAAGSHTEKTPPRRISLRTIVTIAILVALVFALTVVLLINQDQLTDVFTGREAALPREIVRPQNFSELIGTWSGREIDGSAGWEFSFSEGYQVYVSGPEGWYRGKAAIHWELGSEKDALRVPPGASVIDVDIEASSIAENVGRTSVGAFSVFHGTTLKLCSGEPGKTVRPKSFDPASGIRCFELEKTGNAPIVPPAVPQEPQLVSEVPAPGRLVPEGDAADAREAFKNCVAAYKAGNSDEARKCVASAALTEMEAPGMFDMAFGMMSGVNIDEFEPTPEGDRIVFRKTEKQGDMSMSMSLTMVKEDGRWKFGKQ